MVVSGEPVRLPVEVDVVASMHSEVRDPDTHYYRVAAFPATYAQTDDVIITDERGCSYLLSHDAIDPVPLEQRDVDALGMFYEPSQSLSWHTLSDLRRMIYGIGTGTPAAA